MLKKMLTIFLSLILMLSLCSVTIFAAMPANAFTCAVAGTIDANTEGMAEDNFDDKNITETAFSQYASKKSTNVFYQHNAKYGVGYRILSANNASDVNDKVLEISNHKDDAVLLETLKFTMAANYVTELSFDVRFTAVPTSATLGNLSSFYIFGFAGAGGMQMAYDATAAKWKLYSSGQGPSAGVEYVEADKLYSVNIIYDGTTGNFQTYLFNAADDTSLVRADRLKCGNSGVASAVRCINAVNIPKKIEGTDADIKLEINNAKMVVYNTTVNAPGIESSTVENGAEEISADTKSVEVKFDQSIKTTSAVLKTDGADDVTCTMKAVSTKRNTYTVSWTNDLAAGKTYTIDMSGTTNASDISAGNNAVITFKTAEPGIEKLTENFESGTVNKSKFTGDLLTMAYDVRQGEASLVNDGYTGKALKLEVEAGDNKQALDPLTTKVAYTPELVSADEYEKIVVTYRFNLKDMADVGQDTSYDTSAEPNVKGGGSMILMYAAKDSGCVYDSQKVMAEIFTHNSKPMIRSPYDTEDYSEFKEDHWYNIVWAIDGTNQSFSFIDAETGKLVWTKTFASGKYSAGDSLYITPYAAPRIDTDGYLYNEGQTALIDDFAIWRVNPTKNKQKLILDGDVSDSAGKVTMSFNQPIVATADMLAVERATEENENEAVAAIPEILYPDFCSMTVSFTKLFNESEYILDYSGLKAASGVGFADEVKPICLYTFISGKTASTLIQYGNVAYTDLKANSVVSAKIESSEAQTADFILAFYKDDSLSGVVTSLDVDFNAGEQKDVTFTLLEDIDADTLKVFGWNDLETMMPEMEAHVETIS